MGKEAVAFHTGITAYDLFLHKSARRSGILFPVIILIKNMKKVRSLDHGSVDVKTAPIGHHIARSFDISDIKNRGNKSGAFGN